MAKAGGGGGQGGGGGATATGWRAEVLRSVGQSGRLNWSKITPKLAQRGLEPESRDAPFNFQ